MSEAPEPRTLEDLIETFEGLGSVILVCPEEIEVFMDHVRRNNIPTQTTVEMRIPAMMVGRERGSSTIKRICRFVMPIPRPASLMAGSTWSIPV